MKDSTEKVHSTVSEKRVKLHIFEPSKRKIWTVVGKEKEYWLSPEMNYCSCPSYYFGIGDQKKCYHLESLVFAKKENKIEYALVEALFLASEGKMQIHIGNKINITRRF